MHFIKRQYCPLNYKYNKSNVTIILFHLPQGTLNDKTHVLNGSSFNEETNAAINIQSITPDGMSKVFAAILSSPGPIVTFSILVKKGVFRRTNVNILSNKDLMLKAMNSFSQLHFGHIENFTITSNNSKVRNQDHFFGQRK